MRRPLQALTFAVMLLALAALAGVSLLVYPAIRDAMAQANAVDIGRIATPPAVSDVFDAEGNRYSQLRYLAPLNAVADAFIDALLASQDPDFHENPGAPNSDFVQAVSGILAGNPRPAVSPGLTQQLLRTSPSFGNDNPLAEAFAARRLERQLSKDEILAAYINRVYCGDNLYGIGTASVAWFGKLPAGLTLSEAAFLAGLIQAPGGPPAEQTLTQKLKRRDAVLRQMLDQKRITAAEAAAARAEDPAIVRNRAPSLQQDAAMDAILADLSRLLPSEVLAAGGLKIHTTIDRRFQQIAEHSVDGYLSQLESAEGWPYPGRKAFQDSGALVPDYIQGALVAIDNATGGIRALVGGRNFKESPVDRASTMRRPIGSTFSPFVYAAALGKGLLPGTLLDDNPIQPGEIAGAPEKWEPPSSDGDGLLPAALGLIVSRDAMTLRAGNRASLDEVSAIGNRAGFSNLPANPALFLGRFSTTLRELTAAYSLFPNRGLLRTPYLIERIEDPSGKIIYQAAPQETEVLSPSVDFVMNELLEDVIRTGTARSARDYGLTGPAAGKTGASPGEEDGWFAGYSVGTTCGVWTGMDDPSRIADDGQAGEHALRIWVHFMRQIPQAAKQAGFLLPAGFGEAEICRATGGLATGACAGLAYQAQLPKDLIPTEKCPLEDHGLSPAGETPPREIASKPGRAPTLEPAPGPGPAPPPDSTPKPGRSFSEFFTLADPPSFTEPPAPLPLTSPTPEMIEGENYQMFRTKGGFLFGN